MISFRVKKGLGHAQIGLLKEFNSKFPTSIPTPFICRVPPGTRLYICVCCLHHFQQLCMALLG